MNTDYRYNHKNCAGFTLLEVLVAALVMSIGLLGLAGIQMTSLKNTQSASMTSQASILAYSMTDRLRAIPDPDSLSQIRQKWQLELSDTLPDGTGDVIANSTLCPVDNDNNGYLVQIEWDHDRDGNLDDPYEFCFYYEE